MITLRIIYIQEAQGIKGALILGMNRKESFC